MEKYKYNIGDKVIYPKSVVKERVCETCGNIETDYSTVPTKGKITARKYETFYRHQETPITSDVVTMPNGSIVYIPYYSKDAIKPIEAEPAYKIGKNWYAETDLK